jgi:D-xylose transport system substrate-binding protein
MNESTSERGTKCSNGLVFLTLVSLALSVLIGFAVARSRGPASSTRVAADARIRIGLSLDTLKEERWQRDRDIFVRRAGELGAEVLVLSANSDNTRQLRDVESLISSQVDVIVIVPHNGAAMARAADMAKAAGIPVIAYDRLIVDSDLDLYMSFDNIKVGEMQARYLLDHLATPGKGRIVRIYGAKTDNNAAMFKQGQDNILAPYIARGDIVVLHEDWAQDWRPANAKAIMNAALTQFGANIDGVLASNDGTAGGAIQALLEEGLAGKMVVTGQDADLAACQRIMAGMQSMTVYKPLSRLANRAAEVAVAVANRNVVFANGEIDNGKRMVPSILMEVIAVDKHNMMETVVADGFHSAESLRGGN